MFTSLSSSSNWKENAFPPKRQILYYSAAHRKRIGPLHPITRLFLDQFLISWYVSYRAWVTQDIAPNRIKIGQFVWELWHFKDKWLNLEWETGNGCCHPRHFSLDMPLQSTIAIDCCTNGQGTWTWLKTAEGLFQFWFYSIPISFHCIPSHFTPFPLPISILTTCLWSVIAS